MKPIWNAVLASALAAASIPPAPAEAKENWAIYANPLELKGESDLLHAEEGYIAVPENRGKAGSRMILVNYLRVFARTPSGKDPVFMLPGGPGDLTDRRDFAKTWYPKNEFRALVTKYTSDRDMVIVNQRGNHYVLGANGIFEAPAPSLSGASKQAHIEAWKRSLKSTFDLLTARGVDIEGYDFLNTVADVEDVRAALGYKKIILYGFSFGSQLGLGYLRQHPDHVSRALFSGVEPLDYGYDSPDDLWAALMRIAQRAETSPIADQLPKVGLQGAVEEILRRLREKPAEVTIEDPSTKAPRKVIVTAEDFQYALLRPLKPWRGVPLSETARIWPKFVTEIYNGDYRYVAQRKLDGLFSFTGTINLPLVDHSLGISAVRDQQLGREKAIRLIGDPNAQYRAWSDITPTSVISDKIRSAHPIDVPVLLVQGDIDLQTPLENAEHQREFLQHGALVVVENGTHHTSYEVLQHDPQLSARLEQFIRFDGKNADETRKFLGELPQRITIPLTFEAPNSLPLYERPVGS